MSKELALEATKEIKENCGYIDQAFDMALEKAQRNGQILCEQKIIMDKMGTYFGHWIEEELPFSKTTAWRWMQLWTGRSKIKGAKSLAEAKRMIAPAEEPKKEAPPEPEPPAEEQKGDKKSDKPTNEKPKDEKKPKKLTTPAGQEVPCDLVEIFERLQQLRDPVRKLNSILKVIRDACKEGDELYAYVTFTAFETGMKNATRQLRHAMPFAVCPYCGGDRVIGSDIPSECPCKGMGWVNEPAYTAAPKELKE